MPHRARRPVVLNVNDDEARRYVLGRMLRDASFDVLEAATGEAALAAIAERLPDLVLLDVKLPDVDGFEVCRRVKADPATASIPVVMLSAVLVETTYRVHGLESGADGYLTDPLQPPVVIATLRALLRARQADEARRESEAQYRALFEANPLPSWVVDLATGGVLAANDAVVKEFGYSREEFLALEAAHVDPTAEVSRFRRRDGSVFDAETTSRLMRYHGRDARLIVARDVTDRRRREAQQAMQFAVTRVLAESPTTAEAIPRLLAAIGGALACDVGEYWRPTAPGDALALDGFWSRPGLDVSGLEAAARRLTLPCGQSLPGHVWAVRRSVWAPDVATAPDDAAMVRPERPDGLQAAFGFPVTRGDDVTGVMLFFARDMRRADDDLLQSVASVGAQIGEFLERRRAQDALREAEARYRLAARATNDVIWDLDVATGRAVVSEAMRTRFGYAADRIGTCPAWVFDRLHPDDRVRVTEKVAKALAAEETFWSDEYRFQRADGTYAAVADRGYIIRDATGRAIRMVGAMTDMTERAVAEERRRLRALSDGTLRAREEEARRIARELHDEAGQLLVSVHIALDRLAGDTPGVDRARIDEIKGLLDLTEAELRRIAHELRPTVLDDLGLAPALEVLAENVSARSGLAVAVRAPIEDRLPALVETTLYRIVQEGLANAVKHAGASRVHVDVDLSGRAVRCEIGDDGVGFDVHEAFGRAERGLGLLGIAERLDAFGGAVKIDSEPGAGTRLVVTLPLPEDTGARPPR